MAMAFPFIHWFILTAAVAVAVAVAVAASPSPDLVRSSCTHASYPEICLHTLSTYAGPANTPRELAQAGVKVSMSRASRVADYLSGLKMERKRERGAMEECVSQISDSVEELKKTLVELKQLKRGSFRWQMSNAETWASAALTNEETCLDGFKEIDGYVRSDVKKKINNLAKLTSNALYLINRLDQGKGKGPNPIQSNH